MAEHRITTLDNSSINRFKGFLSGVQLILKRRQYDVALEAFLFQLNDADVTDEDVIAAAYSDGYNPILHHELVPLDTVIAEVNSFLTLARDIWNQGPLIDVIEGELRDGYWNHLKPCIDYRSAQIVSVGPHVPYMNIMKGFTYILYADRSRALLLVGNISD